MSLVALVLAFLASCLPPAQIAGLLSQGMPPTAYQPPPPPPPSPYQTPPSTVYQTPPPAPASPAAAPAQPLPVQAPQAVPEEPLVQVVLRLLAEQPDQSYRAVTSPEFNGALVMIFRTGPNPSAAWRVSLSQFKVVDKSNLEPVCVGNPYLNHSVFKIVRGPLAGMYTDQESSSGGYNIASAEYVRLQGFQCIPKNPEALEQEQAARQRLQEQARAQLSPPPPDVPETTAPPPTSQPALTPVPPVSKETKAQREKRLAADRERKGKEEARRAEVAAKKAELQAQETTAYLNRCGVAPKRSGWDGSLLPVRHYLSEHAHDPDSVSFAHDRNGIDGCTVPQMTTKRCWSAVCKFRANNAFGVKVVNVMRFYMTASSVIGSESLDDN